SRKENFSQLRSDHRAALGFQRVAAEGGREKVGNMAGRKGEEEEAIEGHSLSVDNGGPSGNPGQVSEAARGDPVQLALAQLLSQGDLANAITSAVEEQAARIFRGTPKGRPRTHHGDCSVPSICKTPGDLYSGFLGGQQAHGAVKRRVRCFNCPGDHTAMIQVVGEVTLNIRVDAIQLQIDAIVVTSGLSDVDLLLGQPALQGDVVLNLVFSSIPGYAKRELINNQRGVEMDFSNIDIGDINEGLARSPKEVKIAYQEMTIVRVLSVQSVTLRGCSWGMDSVETSYVYVFFCVLGSFRNYGDCFLLVRMRFTVSKHSRISTFQPLLGYVRHLDKNGCKG
ncbi:hypothetical protein L9F63_018718, partial [Diploptera punctata]